VYKSSIWGVHQKMESKILCIKNLESSDEDKVQLRTNEILEELPIDEEWTAFI
jgi:hypothetical protein